jgi:cytochrome c553
MPRGRVSTAFAVVIFAVSTLAVRDGRAAGDIGAGRQKALMCQTCHGLDGKAKIPEAPSLAGQSAVYLTKALNDYRSGARKNDMMSLVAPALKDKDVEDLAAHYSAIEVTVSTRNPWFRRGTLIRHAAEVLREGQEALTARQVTGRNHRWGENAKKFLEINGVFW